MTDRHDIFTFLNKKKLPKNSHKIFTVFQKTVDDGLNPPHAPPEPALPLISRV